MVARSHIVHVETSPPVRANALQHRAELPGSSLGPHRPQTQRPIGQPAWLAKPAKPQGSPSHPWVPLGPHPRPSIAPQPMRGDTRHRRGAW